MLYLYIEKKKLAKIVKFLKFNKKTEKINNIKITILHQKSLKFI